MNNQTRKKLFSSRYITLLIGILFCAAALGKDQDSKRLIAGDTWTLPVPAGNAVFVQVQNNGIDTISKALDANGEVLSQAASWRGREGRYLLALSEDQDTVLTVQVRSTEKHTATGEVIISWLDESTIADTGIMSGLQSIATASNQRVQYFLGGDDNRLQTALTFQSAINQLQSTEYADWIGDIYYEIGNINLELGHMDAAADNYSSALDAYQRHSNDRGIAAAYNALGLAASEVGESDLALEYLDMALAIRITIQDVFYQAQTLNNIGSIERDRDNFANAAEVLEQALVLFAGSSMHSVDQVIWSSAEQIGSKGDLAQVIITLSNLALAKTSMGATQEAIDLWQAAMRLNTEINQPLIAARAEHNLGHALQELGRLDEALAHIDNAASVFEQHNDDYWYSQSLQSIGAVYAAIDELADATTYFEQALSLDSQNQQGRANILRRLASVNWRLGKLELAGEQFAEAHGIFMSNNQNGSAAIVTSEHGQLQYELGNHEQALSSQREAWATLSALGNIREAARAQSRLGQMMLHEGDTEEAETTLQEALTGHRAVFDELYELDTLTALSRAQYGQVSLDSARSATELANKIRLQTLSPDLQSSFLASRRGAFEQYIDLLVDSGKIREAWVVSEQIRARSLLDLIQSENHSGRELNQIRDERDVLLAKLADLSQAEDQSQLIELRREIDMLEGQLRGNENMLANINSPIDTLAIQQQLGDEVTMLSYFVGSESSHLWAITGQQVHHYPLPAAAEIAPIATDLTYALRSHRQSRSRIAYMAAQLSEMVLQPALNDIDGRELVVIADGSLQLVPFGLLPVDNNDTTALVDTTTVTYSPSAKIFDLLDGQRMSATASIVVLADPLANDGNQIAMLDDVQDNFSSPLNFTELLAKRTLSQSAVNITALPGAQLEAAAIENAAEASDSNGYANQVKVMTGTNASHKFVSNGGLQGYGVVHFATHGIVDADMPELSGLVLANSDSGQSMSYLRPHEIAGLNLDADLVVLSGCETGIGKSVGSEGLLSLSRPFLVAGARQVISSLWQVSDQATALLMERFYFHLLQEDKSPEMSLRMAQQWLREQPQWDHPYFWAGFVVQGGRSIAEPNSQLADVADDKSPPLTLVSAAL